MLEQLIRNISPFPSSRTGCSILKGRKKNTVLLEALKKLDHSHREWLLGQFKAPAIRILWRGLNERIPASEPELLKVLDAVTHVLITVAFKTAYNYFWFHRASAGIDVLDEDVADLLSHEIWHREICFSTVESIMFYKNSGFFPRCELVSLFGLTIFVGLLRATLDSKKNFAVLVLKILVVLILLLAESVDSLLRYTNTLQFVRAVILIEHQFFEQHGLGRPPRAPGWALATGSSLDFGKNALPNPCAPLSP